MLIKNLILCLLPVLAMLIHQPVVGAEEPYVNELKGAQVTAGQSFSVTDEKFKSPSSWALIDHSIAQVADNIISFEINFDTSVYFYSKPFTCTVNLNITTYNNPSDTSEIAQQFNNISMVVRFDTTSGGKYKGVALFKFKGAHKYTVTINSVAYSLGGASTHFPVERANDHTAKILV
ncbi:hypothetical protein [Paraflavitalea speifideaquila]|uniref:hypothetical protein n=1 Tax=Paraflavitalea speifideaquila TaxID=3076558 RepID=UPI0028E7C67E|nr:hypothetical protein [Paraflavitalea speifideiaquila]